MNRRGPAAADLITVMDGAVPACCREIGRQPHVGVEGQWDIIPEVGGDVRGIYRCAKKK